MPHDSPSFCYLPWISLSTRNNGEFRVCCQSHVSEGAGILRKSDGSPFQSQIDSLEDVRNSAGLREVRLDMLAGRWPKSCARCQSEEALGIRSRRLYSGESLVDTFSETHARQFTDSSGRIDTKAVPIYEADLRLGNLCNLKCRMCNPVNSSTWNDDFAQLYGNTFYDKGKAQILVAGNDGKWRNTDNAYRWFESENFWQELSEEPLRHIYIAGGEPWLIREHWNFLERLVAAGKASEISLEYNSNITVIPSHAWKLWKKFKQIIVGASIDGVGTVNDYIRHPSNFSEISANLRALDTAEGNFRVRITTTISLLNIFYLPDLLRWKIEQNFARVNKAGDHPIVTCHPLYEPDYLSIQVLPPAAREALRKRFDDFLSWLAVARCAPALQRSMSKIIESYWNFLEKQDRSHLLPKFLSATQDLDRLRRQDFREALPELALALRAE